MGDETARGPQDEPAGDGMVVSHGMTATIEMDVTRVDGTVEHYEADITDLDEDAIRALVARNAASE